MKTSDDHMVAKGPSKTVGLSHTKNTSINYVINTSIFLVGVPRIELESHPPHGRILPLYYTPFCSTHTWSVGVPRIELESHAPEACILPLYYTPTRQACGGLKGS